LTTPTLKVPSDFGVVNAVFEDVVVAIMDAEDDHLQALAKLTSTPSLELLLLNSVNDTMRRDFASSVTRRVIVFSSALN
jgi:hypothetical protein